LRQCHRVVYPRLPLRSRCALSRVELGLLGVQGRKIDETLPLPLL
jgi:hypothetical protein